MKFNARLSAIAYFVLAVMLMVSVLLWRSTQTFVHQKAEAKFERIVNEAIFRIEQHLEMSLRGLYGVQGLFSASERVKRSEWVAYFINQPIREKYPALGSVRYVQHVTAEEMPAFVEEVKAQFPGPLPLLQAAKDLAQAEYYIVKFSEPFDETVPLIGLDLSGDPVRRASMDQARDTGEAAITPRTLPVPGSGTRPQFSIFLPVYRNGVSHLAPEEKRSALLGFVNGVFIVDEFLKNIFGRERIVPDIDFEIFDSDKISPDHLLYDNDHVLRSVQAKQPYRFSALRNLPVADRRWTLRFFALPTFETEQQLPFYVLIFGCLFSVFMFAIIYLLSTSHSRSLKMAEKMTADSRKEIAVRKRIEEDLVASRTAAFNMMEDAEEARKRAEDASNGLLKEIEERKKVEDQLLQSQKMDAIGRLAGGIAHDFNNLLTVINGYSEISLGMLKPGDPLYASIEEIHKAGERAASLTSQLLSFSRRQMRQLKTVNLNTLILDMDKMIRRLIHETIDLVTIPGEGLWSVKADPLQLEQVLVNLVVNACDAMAKSGGKLVIETSNVVLGDEYAAEYVDTKAGEYVLLAVTDNGCGMSEETKSRIFEPFFTTKEKGKGTGLGLATSYGIVQQSGGHIRVYSELNQGTSVKVYLPRVSDEVESAAREKKAMPLPAGHETILLVEDEEMVRNLASRVLHQQGYRLLEAANGVEALRRIEDSAQPIDLIVTDVVMPQMGGKELADRVRASKPGIKILFMSGYAEDAIVHQGILDPQISFIQKPFSPLALAEKVREVLNQPAS